MSNTVSRFEFLLCWLTRKCGRRFHCFRPGIWRSKKLISLPFTDYLPVLSGSSQAVDDLCQLIKHEFRRAVETVVIRADQPVPGLQYESHNVRHELATDSPMEKIESSFASAIRRNF